MSLRRKQAVSTEESIHHSLLRHMVNITKKIDGKTRQERVEIYKNKENKFLGAVTVTDGMHFLLNRELNR